MIHSFQKTFKNFSSQTIYLSVPLHTTSIMYNCSRRSTSLFTKQNRLARRIKKWKNVWSIGNTYPKGELGYITAFSGNIASSNYHPFFVPPIYDILNPNGYFKEEEGKISAINNQIQLISNSPHSLKVYTQKLNEIEKKAQSDIENYKLFIKESQIKRTELRTSGQLTETEIQTLIKESQYQKAELKRKKNAWKKQIEDLQHLFQPYIDQLNALKEERKKRSMILQQWIFQQFQIHNANKQIKNLWEIFQEYSRQTPPAGAGECAAPKLLQHAYRKGLQPIAMAEFWWGQSPKSEIRHHGEFYPACKHKCEPILNFMLQGLDVEPNPLLHPHINDNQLEIIYEDNYLIVVNKPAGMLSVPGKNGLPSVQSIIKKNILKSQVLCLSTE